MIKRTILKVHYAFPGRTIRANYFKRAIPPLWIWLRSGFFVSTGILLVAFGFNHIATILFTFAVIQLVSVSLAAFFQELAKGIQNYTGKRKGKK